MLILPLNMPAENLLAKLLELVDIRRIKPCLVIHDPAHAIRWREFSLTSVPKGMLRDKVKSVPAMGELGIVPLGDDIRASPKGI